MALMPRASQGRRPKSTCSRSSTGAETEGATRFTVAMDSVAGHMNSLADILGRSYWKAISALEATGGT